MMKMLKKRRFVLVDQTLALQNELSQIENQITDYVLEGMFHDVRTAYFSFLRSRPDIMVISIHQADPRVFTTIGKIKNQYPSVRILIQSDINLDLRSRELIHSECIPFQNSWPALKEHLDKIIIEDESSDFRKFAIA